MKLAPLAVFPLLLPLACAGRTAPAPEPASAPSAIAEPDREAAEADPCAPYLADAPPPQSGEFMPVSDEELQAAMILANQEAQPRCAHYHLVHRTLAILALDDPRVSLILWQHEDPVGFLDDIAGTVNEDCAQAGADDWLLPEAAFRVGRTELLGRPLVVVDVIPPPAATTEAHMFALVGRAWAEGQEHREWTALDHYFVLEHSVTREPNHTIVGGWTVMDGTLTHLNMGAGPQSRPEAFVHVIGQNLCRDLVQARTRVEESVEE